MEGSTGRRGFMAGALALGGLAAIRPEALRAEPGRKLGWAIVGLGYYATKQIMPQFAACEHGRITALVSGHPEKARTLAAQYGVPDRGLYTYETFDRIRDNPDVDIVYVVLPNSMHHEYTVRAARAGKHVLCEKPMATSVAEAEDMIAVCRAARRKLMIGYRVHFEATNRHAIALCRQGKLGKLTFLSAEHGFNMGNPDGWRLKRALSGGGSLMDMGIYSIQAARYLTGEEPTRVTALEATDHSDPRFREVENVISWQLGFPSGAIGQGMSSYSSDHHHVRAVGTQGFLDMEPATTYEGQRLKLGKGFEAAPEPVPPLVENQFVGMLDHMSECVLMDRQPIVAGEEGLADMRVIDAIYRSAREGRTIAL